MEPESWALFQTREDFEFVEIALETDKIRKQVDAMIKLFHKCIEIGEGSFTISGHKDMVLRTGSRRDPVSNENL